MRVATKSWQIEEAEAHLREVVREAAAVPQVITAAGEEAVVVISLAEYERLAEAERPRDLIDVLLNGPKLDTTAEKIDECFARDPSPPGDFAFDD
jgi:prevent-host-death family protein